jgi:hypothetical protein
MQLTNIRRAAELTALAEETRVIALRKGASTIDLTSLVRLEGVASRAVRALGIKPSSPAPWSPLRARLAAQANGGSK